MLVEELKELAQSIQEQQAEEQKIEVKAAHIDCPKRLYDTLSSFSNQDTGGILVWMKNKILKQWEFMICRTCRRR